MIKLNSPVIVEGKYDIIKLSNLIDGLIIKTDGFGIFKDKEKQKRDPFYDEAEIAIREELGRKAEIHLKSANKGTIEIEFFSKEDLQSILEALAK